MSGPFSQSMRAQVQAIAEGRLTAQLVAQATIARNDACAEPYHPWVVFDRDNLMAQAAAADARLASGQPVRLLEAMPVAVKDIFNTVDYATQMGSPLWSGFTPGNDARAVFNLKRCGGLVAGKTTTAEFAVHALPETFNPHARDRTPGTSSTGSAVAVALGIVPMALGTQTAGSIIRPASFCGVYGCKPSYGLIPRTGILKTADTLDSVGFLVGHATDLRLGLDAIRLSGRDYPAIVEHLENAERQAAPQGRKWKIGFVRTHTWDGAPDYARSALMEWTEKLAASGLADVEDVQLPAGMERCHELHEVIYHRCLAYYFNQEYKSLDQISSIMREIIEVGNVISNDKYHQALTEQVRLAQAMDEFMAGYDVLVCLSTAGEAPMRHVQELPDPCLMWTMSYLPAVSAPAFTGPSGLPFGVQLVARRYNDHRLFNFIDAACAAELLPQVGHPGITV